MSLPYRCLSELCLLVCSSNGRTLRWINSWKKLPIEGQVLCSSSGLHTVSFSWKKIATGVVYLPIILTVIILLKSVIPKSLYNFSLNLKCGISFLNFS